LKQPERRAKMDAEAVVIQELKKKRGKRNRDKLANALSLLTTLT
jgi:hypothetical protein